MQSQNIPALIHRLWRHLSSRRRKQIFLLLMLMIMVSLVEIVSIGSILPFLAVLTTPDKVFNHKFAIPIIQWLNLSDPKDLLLPFTAAFCAAAVLSASVRLLLVWVQTKLSYSIGADIALNVYKRTLHQPYSIHIARNSSEIINGVYGKAFGMQTVVWGSSASREKALTDGHLCASHQAAFFEQCDVLSLHLRLTDATKGIVKNTDLSAMKTTSLLVNTSRAELIEPDALISGLNRGRPGLAAVDVYEVEPIMQGQALLRLENCICTPHIGYVEQEHYELLFGAAFDNVVRFIQGIPTNIVNPGALQNHR